MTISTIGVQTTVEGWHHWPDAPQHRAYLGQRHRHLFHVEANVDVLHDDREVEFHDLLDFVRANIGGPEFGPMSCEMIASRLLKAIESRYPGRNAVVTVGEDGEVWATVRLAS